MPITKAAFLRELNTPLVVDDLSIPSTLEPGQVLVKIIASGICGSQLGEISGVKGPDRYLPHLMGHEGFGLVEAVGAAVTTVSPGDSVVLHWRTSSGIQAPTPTYHHHKQQINAGWVTTFQSHSIVSENRCTRVPSSTDPHVGALLGCAITTGFGVVERDAQLMIGESIVVYGAGGIGLNIIQAASLRSASLIVAVDLFDNRLSLARSLGATHTINASTSDVNQQLSRLSPQQGFDVFVDNTGLPSIIELGYRITSKTGRVVLVGVPRSSSTTNIFTLPLHFGKKILGSHGGSSNPDQDIHRLLKLQDSGQVNFSKLVSDVYPLSNINDAIYAMQSGSAAGRIIIEP